MNIFLFTIAALVSCFIVQNGYGAEHSLSFPGHTLLQSSTSGNKPSFQHQSLRQLQSRFLTVGEKVEAKRGFRNESTTKVEIISDIIIGNNNADGRGPHELSNTNGKSCIADMDALRLELLFLFNPQSEGAHRNVTSFFLKNTVPQIMQDVQNYYPKSSFGIATYGDFDAWRGRGICYQLVVPLTTDLKSYRQKAAHFQVTKGGRSPEVSFLALTYAATDKYMKWTQSDFSFFEKAKNNKPHVYKVILLITDDITALPEMPPRFDPSSPLKEFQVKRRFDRQSCRRVPLPTAVDVKNVFAKENVYFLGLINGDQKVMQFWQHHAQNMAPRGVVKSIHNASRAAISRQLIKILTYELCSPTTPTKTSTTTPGNRRRTRCSASKQEKNLSSTTKLLSTTSSSSKKHQNPSTDARSVTHTTLIAQPVTPLSRPAVTTSTLPPASFSSTASTLTVSTPTLIEVTPQTGGGACTTTDHESCSSVAPKTSYSSSTNSETQQSRTHDAKSKDSSTEAHLGTEVSDATCKEDDESAQAAGAQKKQDDTDLPPQTQSGLNSTPRPPEASTTTDGEQHPAIITGAAGGAVGIVLLGGALAYYLSNDNGQKGNMDGDFEDVNKDGDFFSINTQRETIVQLT